MDSFEVIISEINNTLETWLEAFAANLPNILVALVIIAVFYALSAFISKWILKLLNKSSLHASLQILLASFVKIIVVISGVFFALGVVGLDKTVVSLMAGVGVIGLALGFAFKDLASNLISGLFIAVQNPFDIGDYIKIRDLTGTVTTIRLRDTILASDNGQKIYIPNKAFMEDPLFNYSQTTEKRVDVTVSVSYEDNLGEVLGILKQEVSSIKDVKQDKTNIVQVREFGLYSILIDVKLWIDTPKTDTIDFTNNTMAKLKSALEKGGFHIPRPQLNSKTPELASAFRQ